MSFALFRRSLHCSVSWIFLCSSSLHFCCKNTQAVRIHWGCRVRSRPWHDTVDTSAGQVLVKVCVCVCVILTSIALSSEAPSLQSCSSFDFSAVCPTISKARYTLSIVSLALSYWVRYMTGNERTKVTGTSNKTYQKGYKLICMWSHAWLITQKLTEHKAAEA